MERTRTINVPLSVEQIRLLAEVTLFAATESAQYARESKSKNAQDHYNLRTQRLSQLNEVFQKISP